MRKRKLKQATDRLRSQNGSALVITLWVVMILAVIALELSYGMRLELRTLDYGRRKLQASELARSGVDAAMTAIGESRASSVRVLRLDSGAWVEPQPDTITDLPVNEARDSGGSDAGSFSVEIISESGKLNINTSDADTLGRLFSLLGLNAPEQLAASIVAARSSRPGGAFMSIEELLNINGIDELLLFGEDTNGNGILDPVENDGDANAPPDNADGVLDTGLAAYLTTVPSEKININLASPEVIAAALGLSPEQSASLEQFRDENKNGIISIDSLSEIGWVTEEMLELLNTSFSTDSSAFTVRSAAYSENKSASSLIVASVTLGGKGPGAFLWREK